MTLLDDIDTTPALAMELLEAQACTPGCLLAMTTLIEQCSCRCGGRWHAALLWAQADPYSGPTAFLGWPA